MYYLGYYTENGEKEICRKVSTKEEAKKAYNSLKKLYECTIWIAKVEFVNPSQLFEK